MSLNTHQLRSACGTSRGIIYFNIFNIIFIFITLEVVSFCFALQPENELKFMAALAFQHNALISRATKVYFAASECSTYTVRPENIKASSLLEKSLFRAALFVQYYERKSR